MNEYLCLVALTYFQGLRALLGALRYIVGVSANLARRRSPCNSTSIKFLASMINNPSSQPLNLLDYESLALQHLSQMAFDYHASGAGSYFDCKWC